MKTKYKNVSTNDLSGIVSIGDGCYSKINSQEKKVFNFRGEILIFLILSWGTTLLLVSASAVFGAIQGFSTLVLMLVIVTSLTFVFSVLLTYFLSKRERKVIVNDEKINFEANVKVVIRKTGIDILTFDEKNYLEKLMWADFLNFHLETADLTNEYLFGMSIKSKTVKLANQLAILTIKNNQRILFYISTSAIYELLKTNIKGESLPDKLQEPTDEIIAK